MESVQKLLLVGLRGSVEAVIADLFSGLGGGSADLGGGSSGLSDS